MAYEVTCDSCDFAMTADEAWRAHDTAREHEAENPAHFVLMDRGE